MKLTQPFFWVSHHRARFCSEWPRFSIADGAKLNHQRARFCLEWPIFCYSDGAKLKKGKATIKNPTKIVHWVQQGGFFDVNAAIFWVSHQRARFCSEWPRSRHEEPEKRSLLHVNEHFPATSNADIGHSEQNLLVFEDVDAIPILNPRQLF